MLVRFILLWVILSGSAVWDLKEHRIPNWWLAAGFFACGWRFSGRGSGAFRGRSFREF